jgi:hypothetical protein
MITALFWILIALVALDVIAHLQHITVVDELKKDLAWIKSKLEGGSS